MEVAEDFRRQGIGTQLMDLLKTCAREMRAEGIGCTYMITRDNDKDNEHGRLEGFINSLGFDEEAKSPIYQVPVSDSADGLYEIKSPLKQGKILPLSKISGYDWGVFREQVIRVGEGYVEDDDDEDDNHMVFLDVGDRVGYDEDTSHLYLNKDKRATGCILFSGNDKRLSLRYLYMLTHGPTSAKVLMRLFVLAFDAVQKSYGPDTYVYVNTQNITSESILKKMTEGKAEVFGYAIERVMYF